MSLIKPIAATLLGLAIHSASSASTAISLTDSEGVRTRLSGPASRVVSLPQPLASGVVAIAGSSAPLVGVSQGAYAAIEDGLLAKIYPSLRSITRDVAGSAGLAPNTEAILALQPELVLLWAGKAKDDAQAMRAFDLPVVNLRNGTEERVRHNLALLADALGQPQRWQQMAKWREQVVTAIESQTASLSPEQRPRVLYLPSALLGLTASGSKNNYNTWYIDLAGGSSVSQALNGTQSINTEQIAHWDPEVILLNNYEPSLTADFIYNDPILSQVAAARNKRIYKVPAGGYRFDSGSQESPLMWMWLANILHPELFSFDIRHAIREQYRFLYNYSPSRHDIDRILHLEINQAAANYAQFRAPAEKPYVTATP